MHVNNLPIYDPVVKQVIGFEIDFTRVPQREFKPSSILQLVNAAYTKHTQNGTQLSRHLQTMEVTQRGNIHTSVVKTSASFITVVATLSQEELQMFCTQALKPGRDSQSIEYEGVWVQSKVTFKQCPSEQVVKKQQSAWKNILGLGTGALKGWLRTPAGKQVQEQVKAGAREFASSLKDEFANRAQEAVVQSLEDSM